MKVALVHDWLTGMRGGEKVLEVFCEIFPEARIFTLLHVPGTVSKTIETHPIETSWLQKIPGIGKNYRYSLPIMPSAIESFDLAPYDLVVSTSHCVAKGCIPGKKAIHVSYCFTPMRYIWDQFDQYFGPGRAALPARALMRAVRPYLQKWDRESSKRVHHFLADSDYVRKRIQAYYGRESRVIYPHIDTDFYRPGPPAPGEDFYLVVSALAPYKRLDLAIDAFNLSGKKLKIIGSGQSEKSLRAKASPNVEFLGWRTNAEILSHYRSCRALVFPGTEDFGMVPLEAMACGKPVIAYAEGGALETVRDGVTGLFFKEAAPEALNNAVRKCESGRWDPETIRSHALRFSKPNFLSQVKSFFDKLLSQ